MTSPRERLLEVLRGEVGYRLPSSGVSKYGAWFAEKVSDSSYRTGDFCAMGQLWSADRAGLLELFGGIDKDWAWVPSWLKHFQSLGLEVHQPGELVLGFMDWNANGIPNHVLMCMGPAHGSEFPTLEFNVRKDGTGPVGCWERSRSLSQALAFVKIPIPAGAAGDDCWMG